MLGDLTIQDLEELKLWADTIAELNGYEEQIKRLREKNDNR